MEKRKHQSDYDDYDRKLMEEMDWEGASQINPDSDEKEEVDTPSPSLVPNDPTEIRGILLGVVITAVAGLVDALTFACFTVVVIACVILKSRKK